MEVIAGCRGSTGHEVLGVTDRAPRQLASRAGTQDMEMRSGPNSRVVIDDSPMQIAEPCWHPERRAWFDMRHSGVPGRHERLADAAHTSSLAPPGRTGLPILRRPTGFDTRPIIIVMSIQAEMGGFDRSPRYQWLPTLLSERIG